LISQAVLNAHKVYLYHTGNTDTFLSFLHDTIALMVAGTPRIEHHLVQYDTLARLTKRHFIAVRKPKPDAKDQRPTKECRVCAARGKRTNKGGKIKTVFICPDCPSQPGLHPEDCYKAYHTKLDYSTED